RTVARENQAIRAPRRRIWTRGSKVAERRPLEPHYLPIPIEKFRRRAARDDTADLGDCDSGGSCSGTKWRKLLRRDRADDLIVVAAGDDCCNLRLLSRDRLTRSRRERQPL